MPTITDITTDIGGFIGSLGSKDIIIKIIAGVITAILATYIIKKQLKW